MNGLAGGCLGVLVVARNEERSLGACLAAWRTALAHLAELSQETPPLLVALDGCTDRSADIAAAHGAAIVHASGGKVAAQQAGLAALLGRAGAGPASLALHDERFVVCSDADILVDRELLARLCAAMSDPRTHVACADKRPLPPRRRSWLARSIHTYNRWGGFASRRTWFSGQLFAIRARDLVYPPAAEIAARAARLPPDRFLRLDQPLRADDVYLSQAVVAAHGIEALRVVDGGVWFRAPETLAGMYRKYRRMRAELERVERLFPELAGVRRAFGRRRYDRLPEASPVERAQFALFQAAVAICRVGYRLERAYHRHLVDRPADLWPPIEETKLAA